MIGYYKNEINSKTVNKRTKTELSFLAYIIENKIATIKGTSTIV